MIYFLMGTITAIVVLALTQSLDKPLRYVLVCAFPLLAAAIYLPLGQPDLPSHPRMFASSATLEQVRTKLLAERPMDILRHHDPDNIGALVSMAKISLRLGDEKAAAEFYRRAIVAAEKTNDVRLPMFKKDLARVIKK